MKIRSLALTALFTACLLQSAMAQQMNNSIAQKTINISPAKNTTNQVKKDFFAEPAPDKTAPTVQITAPQTNQIVKGAVEIKANATDNVGVDRVEFYVDGNTVGVSKNAPYAANWDSTKSHDGLVAVTAEAYDKAGNSKNAAAIIINVQNKPAVPIAFSISPSAGSKLSGIVTLKVTCKPNDAIDRVTFDAPGANPRDVRNDGSGTYEYDWDTTKSTGNSVHLVALDKNSLVLGQAQFTWNVDNTPPPPQFSVTPAPGSKLSGMVTLRITCKPNDAIDRVTFDLPGVNPKDIKNDGSGTYECDWDTTKSVGNSVHLVALDKNSLVLGQAQFTWDVENK